jgi:hypothetical protein
VRFVTDLISRWALATGKQTGTELRGVTELDLPNSLVPVVQARVPVGTVIPAASTGDAMRDSFMMQSVGGSVGVVGQADVIFAAFGQGDWELTFTVSTLFDWAAVPNSLNAFRLNFIPLAGLGTITPFLSHNPGNAATPQQQVSTLKLRVSFAVDQWRVYYRVPALAAGQHVDWAIFLLANRMS